MTITMTQDDHNDEEKDHKGQGDHDDEEKDHEEDQDDHEDEDQFQLQDDKSLRAGGDGSPSR